MSRKNWSEEEIENTLTKLPKIEDRQTKDELFQAIETQRTSDTPSRRKQQQKKQWFFPTLASAAAVLLVILMIPSFMNSGMFTAGENQASQSDTAVTGNNASPESSGAANENTSAAGADEAADNSETAANNNPESSSSQEEGTASSSNQEENSNNNEDSDLTAADTENNEEQPANEENSVENENNEITAAEVEYTYEEEGSTYVTAEVTDNDGDAFVALSTVETAGVSKEEASLMAIQDSIAVTTEAFEALEEVAFNSPSQGEATLIFEEGTMLESLASTEHLYAADMLQEILSIHQVTNVHFLAGSEEVSFGQSGESFLELSLMNRGYYRTEEDEFISARSAGEPMTNGAGDPLSFDETLEAMENPEENDIYESVITEEIEVEDVRYEEETAYVFYSFSGNNTEDLELFQEAVELTAKFFSLDVVQFVDEEKEEVTVVPVQLP